MGAAIEVRRLERQYKNGVLAVAGIDLDVRAGEVYAFLGPNGAGKTTTVRILVTLLMPSGGEARVAGFDVARQAAEVRKRIGVALQEAALDDLMTGRELLRLQATFHGMSAQAGEARAVELLRRVGLVEAADRRVGTYSGGMRRRLDLALALVHKPEVMFLDEPTTGLDPVSRLAMWDEIRKLQARGTTVFLTTQYLEEADRIADRVGIISMGKIVAEGTPAELKAEVGRPHLRVSLVDGAKAEAAAQVVARFGRSLPPEEGADLAIELESGASEIAPIVTALDRAGFAVGSLKLCEPTLDDVFVAKTGHHLEGDEVREEEQA